MTTVEQCSVCGAVKLGHRMSWDSDAEGYVDKNAGDFHCDRCGAKVDVENKKAMNAKKKGNDRQ